MSPVKALRLYTVIGLGRVGEGPSRLAHFSVALHQSASKARETGLLATREALALLHLQELGPPGTNQNPGVDSASPWDQVQFDEVVHVVDHGSVAEYDLTACWRASRNLDCEERPGG